MPIGFTVPFLQQPRIVFSAPTLRSANTATDPAVGVHSPRFAGAASTLNFERLGSSLDAFVPFTQAITEDFFWQFMTLDVFALWMPRIYNSLTRGREPYRLEDDPSVNGKKPNEAQQIAKIGWGTIKGLNWGYFAEEGGREFLVGPGFFSLFGIINGLYRLNVNQATRLPFNALSRFTDTFGQLLHTKLGDRSTVTPQMLAELAADSLEKQWHQPDLKQAIAPELAGWKRAWTHYLNEAYQYETHVPRTQRWKNGVAHWWNTRPFQSKNATRYTIAASHAKVKSAEAALDKATHTLKKAVIQFNHQQPALSYKNFHSAPLQTAQRQGQAIAMQSARHDVAQWLQQAKQWHHVPLTLMQQQAETKGSPISKQTAKLLNRLIGQKLTTTLIATGMVGFYLVILTKLFQSSKQYPGNRSRRASDLQKQGGAA